MNTRSSVQARSLAVTRLFRNHPRLVVVGLVLALIAVAGYSPSRVQSVAPPMVSGPPVLETPTLRVDGVSNTSISLSWTESDEATDYQVERSENMSGPFTKRGDVQVTNFTDNGLPTHKSYVYRVRAIDFSGETRVSPPSNLVYGTTITFEHGLLLGKIISARHFDDLRAGVNAVRKLASLPELDPQNLNGQPVRAIDVTNLRTKLREALTAMQIFFLYTDDPLNTGTAVKAIHIEELQAQSTKGFSNHPGPFYSTTSPAVGGEFSGLTFLPEVPIHLSVLPDRRILFWGRKMLLNNSLEIKQGAGSSDAYVWNMATNSVGHVPNITTNLFCSGHSFLPNGDLFVTGGHRSAHFDDAGEAHTNIFNFSTNSWTAGPVMNDGRWYPYNVTLSNGEVLIMAGSYWSNEDEMDLDPYDPHQFFDPEAAPTPGILDNLIPEIYTPAPGGQLRPMPTPTPARLSTYPYLHLLSNGKVFQAQSGFQGSAADPLSRLFDPAEGTWVPDPLPNTPSPHAIGTSVLLSDDTVMLIGGFGTSQQPGNYVESINLSAPSPSWTPRESMKFPRAYHTATLLPDGKVLVTGGVGCKGRINVETYDDDVPECSAGAVLSPELWDPATGKWTTMNKHSQIRAYHSVAALLPDGRVLVGGGGLPGAVGEIGSAGKLITDLTQPWARLFGHNDVEIFSPPYLYDANGNPASRPSITSTPPESVNYGQQFFLGTSNAGSQPKVSFVRLPSVTHGNNQDQRVVSAAATLVAGGIQVTVPTSSAELPPGYYMVFVLNGSVPSVAAMIRVQNSSLFTSETPAGSATVSSREQGVEFSSSVTGEITHVRFYKASGEAPGSHMARIWDSTGLQVAAAAFIGETSSGWQTAMLQTPLPITAHAKYRITHNVHNKTATTSNVFTVPLTRGPLVAWKSYFSTSTNSYPTNFSSSNLFVDVVFK